MLGKDFIAFIKRHNLDDVHILEGDGQDLPGYVLLKDLASDWHISQRQLRRLIVYGLIPDAICIGKVWYLPCDLVMQSPTIFKLDMDAAAAAPAPAASPDRAAASVAFDFGGGVNA